MVVHRCPMFAVVAAAVAGCIQVPQKDLTPPEVPAAAKPLASQLPAAPREDVGSIVRGNAAFALDLYQHLRTQTGNLFFSPMSLSTALAMTFGGARGMTATQMRETLRFALTQERLHLAYATLLTGFTSAGSELRVANRLWGQQGYLFLDPFLALTRDQYGAELERVDFAGEREDARQKINRWVAAKTNEKIPELIGPGVLTPLTTLVLTNAIYFKGLWERRFDRAETRDEPFTMLDGTEVSVPFMHQTGPFRHQEREGVAVLELPYRGEDLSMFILLPDKARPLSNLEAALIAGSIPAWIDNLSPGEVAVALPRFKIRSSFELAATLKDMGMPDAFGGGADFSGMTGKRDLFISNVIHEAFADVNEEGTEAAAATGVVMARSIGSASFVIDRPFIFLIRDNRSGALLFMGRVVDPRA